MKPQVQAKRAGLLGLLLAAGLSSAAGAAILTRDGGSVVVTGEGRFEVPYNGSTALADFWCTAGNYVADKLRVPQNHRIYRTTSAKRAAGGSLYFSLDPAESVGATGLFGFPDDGSLSVAMAQEMCEVARLLR